MSWVVSDWHETLDAWKCWWRSLPMRGQTFVLPQTHLRTHSTQAIETCAYIWTGSMLPLPGKTDSMYFRCIWQSRNEGEGEERRGKGKRGAIVRERERSSHREIGGCLRGTAPGALAPPTAQMPCKGSNGGGGRGTPYGGTVTYWQGWQLWQYTGRKN